MKLWLDDVRPAPPGWTWAKSAVRAIALLETGTVTEVSLDHDLGQDGMTQTRDGLMVPASVQPAGCGYDVACWIEAAACDGGLSRIEARCHSANPVGRKRIEAALTSARRYWSTRESA